MTESKRFENECERLTKIWEGLIDKFVGKEVECTRNSSLMISGFSIVNGKTYTVKDVHMYLGTTPCFELEEMPGKKWSPDKFKIK